MVSTAATHMLLVQDTEGGVVAVRFPSAEAAREWEEAHPDIEGVGCVRVVTRTEALR